MNRIQFSYFTPNSSTVCVCAFFCCCSKSNIKMARIFAVMLMILIVFWFMSFGLQFCAFWMFGCWFSTGVVDCRKALVFRFPSLYLSCHSCCLHKPTLVCPISTSHSTFSAAFSLVRSLSRSPPMTLGLAQAGLCCSCFIELDQNSTFQRWVSYHVSFMNYFRFQARKFFDE